MAGAREIKKRMKSVKNTHKITGTMEMVSTAKFKKAFDRMSALRPYAEKISELMSSLGAAGQSVSHPLLRSVDEVKHVTLLIITANRGLCGGFNSNLLKMVMNTIKGHESAGRQISLWVAGRKGQGFLRFNKREMAETYNHLDDKVTYQDAATIAQTLSEQFSSGQTDKIEIYSNRLIGTARTVPTLAPLLPLESSSDDEEAKTEDSSGGEFVFEPEPALIMQRLLPLTVEISVFRAVLESNAAEHVARRIAMKNATDSAGEMYDQLRKTYNRTRQAAITQEILEIVGGAEAIK